MMIEGTNITTNTAPSKAEQETTADFCHVSAPIFKLEGNKPKHVNYYSINRQERTKIRPWSRLGIDIDPDGFVLFCSALFVLLFKYTHNENVVVDVQKRDLGWHSETACERFTINSTLKSSMSLLDVAKKISGEIREQEQYSFNKNERYKDSPANLKKTNVLLTYGMGEDIGHELINYSLCVQVNLNKHESGQYGTITGYYLSDIFDSWYVSNIVRHYKRIIYQFIFPKTSIQNLQMLGAAERYNILENFNRTDATYDAKPVHAEFEEKVRLVEDKTAIIVGDQSFSYLQLNDAANQLAHRLKTQYQIIPNDVVGLLLGRSEKMIIGMLGVMKSGGAFLPVDPSYPSNRIKYLLDDAAVKVVVSESKYLDLLKDYPGPLFLIDKTDEFQSIVKDNLPISNTARDLCYVMYTSGSTGNPKGVPIQHRGLYNTQVWRRKFYGFDETFVTLQIASFSFDSSINDIFSMLLSKGTLIVVDDYERLEMKRLCGLLSNQPITNFNMVASHYSLLLDEMDINANSLRIITLAGEKLTKDIIRRHFDKFPDVPIVNEYGPTENSICSTATKIMKASSGDAHIGKPIDNTRVYIFGEEMEIVPPGVTGEIHLAGVGLTQGYLNHPELTLRKFIEHPDLPGIRLYKTGDLGRWLQDGNIEFLGRKDNQLKIRGVRIEPREIEVVLEQHDSVKKAVAIALETNERQNLLVAFVIPKMDVVSKSDLHNFMATRLPKHMIPNCIIKLDVLPLLPNGKLDRQKLLSILSDDVNGNKVGKEVNFQENLELTIIKLWKKLLHVNTIGLKDNFFELGGDSLLAVRMLASVENIFGRWIPISEFLKTQSIEGLTASLKQKENFYVCKIVVLRDGGFKPPLFLIHNHPDNVIEYLALSSHFTEDQPIFALPAHHPNESRVSDMKIEDFAYNYIKEIKRAQPEGPYYIGGFCFGGLVAFEIAQQLKDQGDRVAFLSMIQTTAPGYPVISSETTFFKKAFYKLSKRFDIEWTNLNALEKKEKLLYLLERIRLIKDMSQYEIEKNILSTLNSNHFWSGKRSASYNRYVIVQACNRAFEKYIPKPYFGDIVLFPAKEQPKGIYSNPTMGWDRIVCGNIMIYEVPGHQQTMLKKHNVMVLATTLKECLNKIHWGEGIIPENSIVKD